MTRQEFGYVVNEQVPVVCAESVAVSRGGVRVLENVAFDLAAGEVVAVRGPSGAGKTTLLAMLCGLLRPDAGTVRVNGTALEHLPDRKRSAIRLRDFGLVFQDDELLPELTLGENVSLPLRLGGGSTPMTRVREAVRQELSRLGIGELIDRLPAHVSGGQLQRAAVARAVIHRPRVVLADEPTASLDEAAARSAMRSLIDLARGRGAAVVIVTHDDAVAGLCDRSIRLRDGIPDPEGEAGEPS